MILAFTGAGISKASGIPTFEDQGDLRTKLSRYFSYTNKSEYSKIISRLSAACEAAEPNDAHKALAEYRIPTITMNIDGLHQRAGASHLLPIHGTIPNIVLYGDPAPLYQEAHNWVFQLRHEDIFLIIGTSYYTNISEQLKTCAIVSGAKVVEINTDAEHKVRQFIAAHKSSITSFEEFISREPIY